jgi:precorrin-6Y C5,15-methyltransferase (decarboxylating)
VPDRPRDASVRSAFGNPDETFVQSKPKHGLLTPAEVRSVALAQMALAARSIVWDVGAGSGSVSVEAAQLSPAGEVFAIEQDSEDAELIRENAARFDAANVTPVTGRAPDVWADLPDPDAVFMEGSGREIVRLAELAFERLKPGGRLVCSIASIEALHEVRSALAALTSDVNVWMLNISRGTDQLERLRFDALNPAFLIAATKR